MNDSESQVEALQRQMFVLLLVSLVVSATLAAYLYYQQHIFHKDTANLRQQAGPMINAFATESAGAANFVNQIRVYGGMNPEFSKEVLSKYGIPPIQPAKSAPVKK